MKKYERLEDNGWEQVSYEYDGDAQQEAKRIENMGFQTKLVRERTDTKGLKMFSIWKRSR